jgi:hypothetical protein
MNIKYLMCGFILFLPFGFNLNAQDGGLTDELSLFEKKYAATLSSDEQAVKLIGFKTVQVEQELRAKIRENMDSIAKMDMSNNIYFAKDYSYYRMYFPIHTAIINYNNVNYTANEKGIVLIPDLGDVDKIKIIGRKISETVKGTGSNIIDGDKILLKNELKQEIIDGVKTGYSYQKEKICVFSLDASEF